MQLASFLPHYQLVCISFDISSFSLISYKVTSPDKYKEVLPFAQEMLPNTFQPFDKDSAYMSVCLERNP